MKITNTKKLKASYNLVQQGHWYVDDKGILYIAEEEGVLEIQCGNYHEYLPDLGNLMEVDVEIKILEKK